MNEVAISAKVRVDKSELDALRLQAGSPMGAGGAATGAPPPPPPPAAGASGGWNRAPAPVAWASGSGAPPPLPPPAPPSSGAPPGAVPPGVGAGASSALTNILVQSARITIQQAQVTMTGAGANGGASGETTQPDGDPRRAPAPGGRPNQFLANARGFAGNVASTATGVALGNSIFGFFVGAAEQWQQTDIALKQLDRTFDGLTRKAGSFAANMGATRVEAAALLQTLGAQTGTVDIGQARTGVAFGRAFGMDPQAVLQFQGRTTRRTGFMTDGTSMQRVAGQARLLGQNQGMLPEFMDALSGIMDMQYGATGTASLHGAQTAMNLPSIIFGSDDARARGRDAVGTLQSMQGMMSGSTSPGMRVELLRAMGYGRQGGPGYLDAMERLESGVLDPRNMRDLFGRFRTMGVGAEEAAMLLMPDAKRSGMSVRSLRAMTHKLMSDEGYAALRGQGDDFRMKEVFGESFTAGLSKADREAFEKRGWGGLGEEGTAASQYRRRQMDDMIASAGPQMLKSVMDMTESARNLGGALDTIIKKMTGGQGFLDMLNGGTEALEQFTQSVENAAQSVEVPVGAMPSYIPPGIEGLEAILRKRLFNEDTRAPAGAK